jgi:6-phosphogluconolactonase (cycloisomerase 2 family)
MRRTSLSALALGLAAIVAAAGARAELTLVGESTGSAALNFVHLTPDGRFLLATTFANSIVSLARNQTTGGLTPVDSESDGAGGVAFLEDPLDAGIDPSGRHVYVPSISEDALTVFALDATGELDFVEVQRDGFASVSLAAPWVARVSPDGRHVYVGAVAQIAIFERDPTSGGLDFVATATAPDLALMWDIEFPPDGSTLHAGDFGGRIHSFTRDAATGLLQHVDSVHADDESVRSLAASRDGRLLFAATTGFDGETSVLISSVAVYARDGAMLDFVDAREFPGTSQSKLVLAAGGAGVWTSGSVGSGYQQDYIPIDPASGLLGATEVAYHGGTGGGPSELAASRDGRHLYAGDDSIPGAAILSLPVLAFVELQADGIAGVSGLESVRSAAVSPEGLHVYTAAVDADAVALFTRHAETGTLDFVEAVTDAALGVAEMDGPTHVTLSPDGKHVYVCALLDGAINVFSRNASTGALTFVEAHKDGTGGVTGLDDASTSVVSPDGKHLYVAAFQSDAVAVFSRNAATGALGFVEAKRNGLGGVTGLDGARGVAVSPSGNRVFVASSASDAVAVFSRHATTGVLTFVGSSSTAALDGAAAVAVSRDGRHLYVTAETADSLSAFSIGPSGALAEVDVETEQVAHVRGLDRARGVAITADDRHVVVASEISGALAVFRRDPATGELGYAQVVYDESDAPGLLGATGVAGSADGRHLYAAGRTDSSLVVFAPEPGPTALGGAALAIGVAAARGHRPASCRRAPRSAKAPPV